MSLPVTCIIPVHNNEKSIEKAIESAFNAGCDYVLAYDDHSTDNSLQIMIELRDKQWRAVDKYPHEVGVEKDLDLWARSHVLHLIGWRTLDEMQVFGLKGVNVARNFLVGHSPWGLIIPLDADDTLHDIRPLVEAWRPGTWVYGNHCVHNQGQTLYHGAPIGMLSRKEVTGVTFLFHKDDWLKVGGFDPDFAYAEDYAFQCALQANGVEGVYVDTLVYERYLKPEGNERTAKAGLYWPFYHQMARQKWPSLFTINR